MFTVTTKRWISHILTLSDTLLMLWLWSSAYLVTANLAGRLTIRVRSAGSVGDRQRWRVRCCMGCWELAHFPMFLFMTSTAPSVYIDFAAGCSTFNNDKHENHSIRYCRSPWINWEPSSDYVVNQTLYRIFFEKFDGSLGHVLYLFKDWAYCFSCAYVFLFGHLEFFFNLFFFESVLCSV